MSAKPLLIGSTFPLSLIRRKVVIEPQPLAVLRELVRARSLASFWGHRNTLAVANTLLGVDLAPKTERPALHLTATGLLELEGEVFDECWVISPEYARGFRPAVGEEVPAAKIQDWQVLRLVWVPIEIQQ